MKILWICNVPNKDASKYMGFFNVYGGWLSGLSDSLKQNKELSLYYCFPILGRRKQEKFEYNGITYYSFYIPKKMKFLSVTSDKENEIEKKHLKKIIEEIKPDLIHIFGTEYVHSFMVVKEYIEKYKIICSIQGLTSVYAKHFLAYIPFGIYSKWNISCLFRGTLLKQEKDLFIKGRREIQLLNICSNVIGRTDWDKACTYFINKNRKYYLCNETLRKSFYTGKWEYKNCIKYSIFMSQASSPIKGLNILIQAIKLLKDEYPGIKLRIAGNNFIKSSFLIERLKISTYGQYIFNLIKESRLEDNIIFTGELSEKEMKEEYLKANVFVSPSSIENSSNSIGEAMILGLPVISSDVGGINSLLENEKEGLLYQGNSVYLLADKIKRIFDDKELACKLGEKAKKRAEKIYDPIKNQNELIKIYKKILNIEN